MKKNEICKRISEIILQNTVMSAVCSEMNDDTDLVTDLGYDSVTTIAVISELENEFGIEFEVEELISDTISKYGSLCNVVLEKLESKGEISK